MISQENFNEQLEVLNKKRKTIQSTIDSFQTGYSLPGHLEIQFLDAHLGDLFDKMCIANEAAIVPLLREELVAVHKEIVAITNKL